VHLRQLIGPKIKEHQGRIVKHTDAGSIRPPGRIGGMPAAAFDETTNPLKLPASFGAFPRLPNPSARPDL
jgi:hypothetical protein